MLIPCAVGYYLYTSGGDATKARTKAEHDARVAREKTLDGAERIGDKIDKAYDDTKREIENRYKSAKSTVETEYNKDKQEIGKKVEVSYSLPSSSRSTISFSSKTAPSSESTSRDSSDGFGESEEFGKRWYGAFGGFGGLGVKVSSDLAGGEVVDI